MPVCPEESVSFRFSDYYLVSGGTRWRSWLRHCCTSRKVAGSIPDGFIGIFRRHNPSSRTMALGSTQPLTEMSTRNISWGVKAGGAYGWQPYHLHVPIVLKSVSLNLLEPSGPVQSCNGIALPLPYCLSSVSKEPPCPHLLISSVTAYVACVKNFTAAFPGWTLLLLSWKMNDWLSSVSQSETFRLQFSSVVLIRCSNISPWNPSGYSMYHQV